MRSLQRRLMLAGLAAVAMIPHASISAGRADDALAVDLVARNRSRPTACAEEDNVSVALLPTRRLRTLYVTATHPAYDLAPDNCAPDFRGCALDGARDFVFAPGTRLLYADARTRVEAVRVARWFLPRAMEAAVAGGPSSPAHYVRLSRRIESTALLPEVLVIYMDGNVRLKPQAPDGQPDADTCFGSSVLIGPADPEAPRPVAEVDAVTYEPAHDRFGITYRHGGLATLDVAVDRARAVLTVQIGYPTGPASPAAIFRSMFVTPGNADVDAIRSANGTTTSVLDFQSGSSRSFRFFRGVRSAHNTSAPDITIATVVN